MNCLSIHPALSICRKSVNSRGVIFAILGFGLAPLLSVAQDQTVVGNITVTGTTTTSTLIASGGSVSAGNATTLVLSGGTGGATLTLGQGTAGEATFNHTIALRGVDDARIYSQSLSATGVFAGFTAQYDVSTNGGFHLLSPRTGASSHVTTAGDYDTYLSTRNAGNSLLFAVGNVEKMRISGSSGNVGIGAVSPAEKLEVFGGRLKITNGSNSYGWIYAEDTNHSIILRGDRDNNVVNATNYYQYGGPLSAGNKGHRFWTGGLLADQAERMRIADDGIYMSGNVGIGTTSPGTKLSFGASVPNSPLIIATYEPNATGVGMDIYTAGMRLSGDPGGGSQPVVDMGYYANSSATHSNWRSKMIVLSNGNVGIGTANTNFKLDVNGQIAGTNGTTSAPGYTFRSAANAGLYIFDDGIGNNLKIQANGNDGQLVLSRTGNVGIGMTTPSAKLDVVGDGRFSGNLNVLGTFSAANWSVSGTTTFNSGVVGVGTSSPSGLGIGGAINVLNVHKSGGSGVLSLSSDLTTSSITGQIAFGSTGMSGEKRTALIYSTKLDSGTVNTLGDLRFGTFNNGAYTDAMVISNAGNVGIGTSTPAASMLQISGNPNAPTAPNRPRLQLTDTANGGGDWLLQPWCASGGDGHFAILRNGGTGNLLLAPDGNGKVGIGTATPTKTLVVNSNADAQGLLVTTSSGRGVITLQSASASANPEFDFNRSNGGGNAFLMSDETNNRLLLSTNFAGGSLEFWTGSQQPRMKIDGNGNVGIGTTNPQNKLSIDAAGALGFYRGASGADMVGIDYLHVDGGAGDVMRFRSSVGTANFSQTNMVIARTTGNVGIGTTAPAAKLDVNGVIIADSGSSRPITLGGNVGSIVIKGDAGGWAFGLHAKGSAGTERGGFGFLGGGDTLSYYYIGDSYANPTMIVGPGSGNVGIGTSAPQAKLDVVGNANISGNLTVGGTFSAAGYAASNGTIAGGAAGLTLNAGGTNQNVTITPSGTGATIVNGNVGIGTNSPGSPLTVGTAAVLPGSAFNGKFNFQAGVLGANGGTSLKIGDFSFDSGGNHAGLGVSAIRVSNGTDWTTTGVKFQFDVDNTNPVADNILALTSAGNVGIGTTNPGTYKLAVNGTIHAKEVVVDQTGWADDVFDPSYRNAPLSEVEQHIKEHGHLPGVPSAGEISEKGVSVGEMQATLLRKIEELTLHQIAQEKRMAALENENAELRARVTAVETTQ